MLYAFQVHIPNLTVTLFDYWLQEDWTKISDGDVNSMLFPARRTDRKERREIWATWIITWRKYGPNSITARQWKADTIVVTATGPEEFCSRVADWIFRTWGASASIHESEDQDGPPLAIYDAMPMYDGPRWPRSEWVKLFQYFEALGIDNPDLQAISRKTGKPYEYVRQKSSKYYRGELDKGHIL